MVNNGDLFEKAGQAWWWRLRRSSGGLGNHKCLHSGVWNKDNGNIAGLWCIYVCLFFSGYFDAFIYIIANLFWSCCLPSHCLLGHAVSHVFDMILNFWLWEKMVTKNHLLGLFLLVWMALLRNFGNMNFKLKYTEDFSSNAQSGTSWFWNIAFVHFSSMWF